MEKKAKIPAWSLYISAILVLILGSKTAIESAGDGVRLCIQSVIPSLFPFIVLSGMLTGSLSEIHIPRLKLFNKLLCVPRGSELLVVLGLLGGYPVGAQNICDAYRDGFVHKNTAKRMLVFCNNTGPAFIFGIVAPQFDIPSIGWYLWGIIILSSFITAIILPGSAETAATLKQPRRSAPQALNKAVKTMGSICGWVVIFRVFLGFTEQWFLDKLPQGANVFISGLLELTNGCVQLGNIPDEFARFALAAVLLSFGGVCVTMQTATVAQNLGMDGYLPGKLLQSCISYILCLVLQPFLFPGPVQPQQLIQGATVLIIAILCVFYFRYNKQCSRFLRKSIVYCQHRT